jgi:3-oxoacyl-[acyl-carrier protein] reductase
MGRLGEVGEFAGLAAFLASERASYITGQSIAVDGGWIKGLL